MMEGTKYLKLFDTEANYENYINGDSYLPNVSLTEEDNVVHYNPKPYEYDYSKDCFTIEVLDSGTLTWNGGRANNVRYNINSGSSWGYFSSSSFAVNAGDIIQFKTFGSNKDTVYNDYYGEPSITIKNGNQGCRFNVYGNIASLLFYENYENATELSTTSLQGVVSDYDGKTLCGPFQKLFKGSSVVDASNLVIPFTNMGHYTCLSMFEECSNLLSAPKKLPATNFVSYSDGGCYEFMFKGCTSLVDIPTILPCTSLNMRQCYYGMFQNCTKITKSPKLPAPTLTRYAYAYMFNGCSKLNNIECLATNVSVSNCLTNWVSGVAASGTFTKASSMSSWPNGASGIPNGWAQENA